MRIQKRILVSNGGQGGREYGERKEARGQDRATVVGRGAMGGDV